VFVALPALVRAAVVRVHQHGAAASRIGGAPRPAKARLGPRRRSRGALWNDKNSRPDPDTGPVVAEPEDHAIGRSRGGLTTKAHALTDGRGRALVLLLTAGNVNDTLLFDQLMAGWRVERSGRGRPRTRPDYLVADKGLQRACAPGVRRGIAHTIPEPGDQQANRRRRGRCGGRPVGFDKARYRRRKVVERGF
jgi:hypothetical protein